MNDYKSIAAELDSAVSEIMAAVYRSKSEESDAWVCDPVVIRNGVMRVARTAQWARGLGETHEAVEAAVEARSRERAADAHSRPSVEA